MTPLLRLLRVALMYPWVQRRGLVQALTVVQLIAVWPAIYPAMARAADTDRRPVSEECLRIEALWCVDGVSRVVPMRALRDAVHAQWGSLESETERAVRRARRAARLPDSVRLQAGARIDRDTENRVRLSQDFDNAGNLNKASLEDRNTYQDDHYVDVRLAIDWRLRRARWSDDEIALRREQTALRTAKSEALREAAATWYELTVHADVFCLRMADPNGAEDESPSTPRTTAAAARARAASPEGLRLVELATKIVQLQTLIDAWSGGWLSAFLADEPGG